MFSFRPDDTKWKCAIIFPAKNDIVNSNLFCFNDAIVSKWAIVSSHDQNDIEVKLFQLICMIKACVSFIFSIYRRSLTTIIYLK